MTEIGRDAAGRIVAVEVHGVAEFDGYFFNFWSEDRLQGSVQFAWDGRRTELLWYTGDTVAGITSGVDVDYARRTYTDEEYAALLHGVAHGLAERIVAAVRSSLRPSTRDAVVRIVFEREDEPIWIRRVCRAGRSG